MLIPMWDPQLAVTEMQRIGCPGRVPRSRSPRRAVQARAAVDPMIGPLLGAGVFAAANELGLVISMHVGLVVERAQDRR